jgi:hypothetical protein
MTGVGLSLRAKRGNPRSQGTWIATSLARLAMTGLALTLLAMTGLGLSLRAQRGNP